MNTQSFELVDIVKAEPRGDQRLYVAFSDGTEGEFDLGGLLRRSAA